MEQEAFTDSTIADYYNKNFVNYQVDIDSEIGKLLTKQYDVAGFPTSLYLDKNKKVVARKIGFKDKDDFLTYSRTVPLMYAEPASDLKSKEAIHMHLKKLDSINSVDDELLNTFFNLLDENEYNQAIYKDMLLSKVIFLDFENKGFKYVLKNLQLLSQDTALIEKTIIASYIRNRSEIIASTRYKTNLIAAIALPISKAQGEAKSIKDSMTFNRCIQAKELVLKTVYGHVPKHSSVAHSKECIIFYTKTVQDVDKAKDAMSEMYALLLENTSPKGVTQENERIKMKVKEKIAKSSPHIVLTHKDDALLNGYLIGYKNDIAFLLENFQRVDPTSPKIKHIEDFSRRL